MTTIDTTGPKQVLAQPEQPEETSLGLDPEKLSFLGLIHPDTGLVTTQVGVGLAHVPTGMVRLTEGHLENESGARGEPHSVL